MFSFFKKKIKEPSKPGYTVPGGSKNRSLEEIDTTYWETKNKGWMDERRANWEKIVPMLRHQKDTAKAMNIVKTYYLRGKMPNWKALEAWRSYGGHLDLLCFLWLHPSWDETLLKELRDLYIYSDLIIKKDLSAGFERFLRSQIIGTTSPYNSMDEVDFPYLEGHGELLFRVLLGEPIQTTYDVMDASKGLLYGKSYQLHKREISDVCIMGGWLCNTVMLPIHNDFLYQYDQPLEWWYKNCTRNEEYFAKQAQEEAVRYNFKMALYQIHNFNTQKEGDTCRTRFVHKIRKILDEREFISEFKQMWEDTKAGKIEVKDPWKR